MLYNKYQPKSFKDAIGNTEVFSKLQGYIDNNNIPHCLLFSGELGCGKSTSADIISKAIPNAYVEVIDASVDNGVAVSREIASTISQIPISFKNKVYILEEIHNVSDKFYDALLLITNDPPDNIYFIICTTLLNKVSATIKSRFLKFNFQPPDIKTMRNHLSYIVKEEGITTDRSVLTKICEVNSCIPRSTINALELLVGVNDIDTQLKLIDVSETQETSVGYELAKLLSKGAQWKAVSALLKDVKDNEVEGIRRTVLNYFNTVLLNTGDKNSALILDSFSKEMYDVPKTSLLLAVYENV